MESRSGSNPAPFAVRDDQSAGRVHDEPDDRFATPFQQDRRRIVQSTAFRRLEYKTQVFVTHEHDHFRTRLTHTLEVAEISRRLAHALGVNETLAETIALAHDLGHPPFGHAGEAALHKLMRDHGGFEHNAQSLRIVEYLEHPFPPFRGLNLTFEVREGLAKHHTAFDKPRFETTATSSLHAILESGPQPSIEGQIAALADSLAYDSHDLEDALGANLIGEADLTTLRLWSQAAIPIRGQYPEHPLPAIRRPILDAVATALIENTVGETQRRIAEHAIKTVDDVRSAPEPLVSPSSETASALAELEAFLLDRAYRHPRLKEMDAQAADTVTAVFAAFADAPQSLPPRYADRVERFGLHRVICDYVAGMTDRYCEQTRNNLHGNSNE